MIRNLISTLSASLQNPKAVSFRTLNYDWKKSRQTRIDVINHFTLKINNCKYLEIGCRDDKCFNEVIAAKKIGVDPVSGGTHRMTSDEYFKDSDDLFDVVFIDGLHTYEQSYRDAQNAFSRIECGGVVVFHDMIPRSWRAAYPKQISHSWNGDVWKTGVHLSKMDGVAFLVVEIDHGVGVAIKTSPHVEFEAISEKMARASFNDYLSLRDSINTVSWNEFVNDKKFFEVIQKLDGETEGS